MGIRSELWIGDGSLGTIIPNSGQKLRLSSRGKKPFDAE